MSLYFNDYLPIDFITSIYDMSLCNDGFLEKVRDS